MHRASRETLRVKHNALDPKKAVGVDRAAVREYGQDLESRLEWLESEMGLLQCQP
jgi:hypothetical protein